MNTRLATAGLAWVVAGCAPKPTMVPEAGHFRHETGYEVEYLGAGPGTAMGDGWRLDNFYRVSDEPVSQDASERRETLDPDEGEGSFAARWRRFNEPDSEGEADLWELRTTGDYVLERHYDLNDDGRIDSTLKEPVYDLRFTHRETDGVLWLRSIPLGARLEAKSLRTLAERYLDGLSGGSSVWVQFGEEGPLGSVDKRWAVKKLASVECQVSGAAAHAFDVQILDVDRVSAGDAQVSEVARVVLIDPGYTKRIQKASQSADYRILLLAGYSNRPEDFEALAPELSTFLGRLKLKGGGRGTDCAVALAHAVRSGSADQPSAVGGSGEEVVPMAGRAESPSSVVVPSSESPAAASNPAEAD